MAKRAYVGVNGVARKVKKIYIGVGGSVLYDLPSGYTQMEYIEASGTQFIDVGFMPNQNTKVIIDFQVENTNVHVFGSRTAFTDTEFVLFWASNSDFCVQMNNSVFNGGSFDTAARHTVEMTSTTMKMDGATKATYSVGTFQCAYNMYLFSCPNSSESENVKGKIFSCKVYDGDNLIRDFVPCTNASGAAGMYDAVNGVFYPNAGTGTFATGPMDKGTARLVKKGYVGVGGVARPFWGGGEVVYWGQANNLEYGGNTLHNASGELTSLASSKVGDYALFWALDNGDFSCVTAYNSSLTRTVKYDATEQSYSYGGGSSYVDGLALFSYKRKAGSMSSAEGRVFAYNASLTKSTASTNLSDAYSYKDGAKVGNYGLFAGGYNGSATSNKVDAYNSSLTKTTASNLSKNKRKIVGLTFNGRAMFAGGIYTYKQSATVYDQNQKTVDLYDSSLTKSTAPELSGEGRCSGAVVGSYALFHGGGHSNYDVYNESFTRSSLTGSGENRDNATTLGEFAIFAGGTTSGGTNAVNVTEVFDSSLTRTLVATSINMYDHVAETVGNYALFAGGNPVGSGQTVDVFTIA